MLAGRDASLARERKVKDDEADAVREALEVMVYQFAYDTVKDGQPALMTGGLSALEDAFDVLGWDDPYIIPDPVWCDAPVEPRCPLKIHQGTPTLSGYKHYCLEHGDIGRAEWEAWHAAGSPVASPLSQEPG